MAQKPHQTALGVRPAANDPEEVAFLLAGCIAKFGSRERAAVILTALTDQCRNHPDKVEHCRAPDIDRCVSFWRTKNDLMR